MWHLILLYFTRLYLRIANKQSEGARWQISCYLTKIIKTGQRYQTLDTATYSLKSVDLTLRPRLTLYPQGGRYPLKHLHPPRQEGGHRIAETVEAAGCSIWDPSRQRLKSKRTGLQLGLSSVYLTVQRMVIKFLSLYHRSSTMWRIKFHFIARRRPLQPPVVPWQAYTGSIKYWVQYQILS